MFNNTGSSAEALTQLSECVFNVVPMHVTKVNNIRSKIRRQKHYCYRLTEESLTLIFEKQNRYYFCLQNKTALTQCLPIRGFLLNFRPRARTVVVCRSRVPIVVCNARARELSICRLLPRAAFSCRLPRALLISINPMNDGLPVRKVTSRVTRSDVIG